MIFEAEAGIFLEEEKVEGLIFLDLRISLKLIKITSFLFFSGGLLLIIPHEPFENSKFSIAPLKVFQLILVF